MVSQEPRETWKHTRTGIRDENYDLVCDAEDPFECTHLDCNVGKPKVQLYNVVLDDGTNIRVVLSRCHWGEVMNYTKSLHDMAKTDRLIVSKVD